MTKKTYFEILVTKYAGTNQVVNLKLSIHLCNATHKDYFVVKSQVKS